MILPTIRSSKECKKEVQEMKVIFSVKQFRWREGEREALYRQSEMCIWKRGEKEKVCVLDDISKSRKGGSVFPNGNGRCRWRWLWNNLYYFVEWYCTQHHGPWYAYDIRIQKHLCTTSTDILDDMGEYVRKNVWMFPPVCSYIYAFPFKLTGNWCSLFCISIKTVKFRIPLKRRARESRK